LQSFGARKHDPLRIVDFGTGSGCIIISLLREFPNAYGVAVDISIDALKVAKKNAEDLGVSDRISFVCSSWNDSILVNGETCFDVVVSNPPYIESNVIHDLQGEVIHFDPLIALDGGEKGLNPYDFLIPQLKFLLKKAGKAFFEIGKGQEVEIERLIEKSDATLSRLSRDMAGIIRVVDISCGDK
ncbi:MAG: N5-glutamine methyltransferase family protein, partial [Bdellovibrionales bacterium]